MPDILNPNEPQAVNIPETNAPQPTAPPDPFAGSIIDPTLTNAPAPPVPVRQIDLGTIDPRFANAVTRPINGLPQVIDNINTTNFPGIYRDNIAQRNYERSLSENDARVASAGNYLLGMQSRVQQDYVAQQEQFRQQTQFIQKRIDQINQAQNTGINRVLFGDSTNYANRRDVNIGRGQFGERGGGVFGALGYVFGSIGAQFTAWNAKVFEDITPGKGAETYQKANDFTRSLVGLDSGAGFVNTPRDEALRRYRKAEEIYQRNPTPENRKQRDYFYDEKNLYDNPLSSKFYENVGADLTNLRRLVNNVGRTAAIVTTIDDGKPSAPSNNLGGWSLNPFDLLPKSSRAVLASVLPTNWGVGLNPWVNKPSLNQAQLSKGYRETSRAIWLDGRQFEDTNNPYTKDGLFYDSRRIVNGKDTYSESQKVIGTVFSALTNPGDAVSDLLLIDNIIKPLAKKVWSALPVGKKVINEVSAVTPTVGKVTYALSPATERPALPPAPTPKLLQGSRVIISNPGSERLRITPAKVQQALPPAPRKAQVRQITSNAEAAVKQTVVNANGTRSADIVPFGYVFPDEPKPGKLAVITPQSTLIRGGDVITPYLIEDAVNIWDDLVQVKLTPIQKALPGGEAAIREADLKPVDFSTPWTGNLQRAPEAGKLAVREKFPIVKRKYAPDWVQLGTTGKLLPPADTTELPSDFVRTWRDDVVTIDATPAGQLAKRPNNRGVMLSAEGGVEYYNFHKQTLLPPALGDVVSPDSRTVLPFEVKTDVGALIKRPRTDGRTVTEVSVTDLGKSPVTLVNFIVNPPTTLQEHKAAIASMLQYVSTPKDFVKRIATSGTTEELYNTLEALTSVRSLAELAQVTGVSSALSVPHTTVRKGQALVSLKFPASNNPVQVNNLKALSLTPEDIVSVPHDVLMKNVNDIVAGRVPVEPFDYRKTAAYSRQRKEAIDELSRQLGVGKDIIANYLSGGKVKADVARTIDEAILDSVNTVLAAPRAQLMPAIEPTPFIKRDVTQLTLEAVKPTLPSKHVGVIDNTIDVMAVKVEDAIDVVSPTTSNVNSVIDSDAVTNDIIAKLNNTNPLGGGRTYTPTRNVLPADLSEASIEDIRKAFDLGEDVETTTTPKEMQDFLRQYTDLDEKLSASIANDIVNDTLYDDTIPKLLKLAENPPVKILNTNNTSDISAETLLNPVGKGYATDNDAVVNVSLAELARLEQKVNAVRNALEIGDDLHVVPHADGYTIVSIFTPDVRVYVTPDNVSTNIMGANVKLELSNDNLRTLIERAFEALPRESSTPRLMEAIDRIPNTIPDVLHNVEISIPQVIKVTDYADIGTAKIPNTNRTFTLLDHGTVLRGDKTALVNILDLVQRTGRIGDHITEIGYPTRFGVLSSREVSALPKEALSAVLEDLQGVQLEIIAGLDRLNNANFPAVAIGNDAGVETAIKFFDYKTKRKELGYLPTLGNPDNITESKFSAGKSIGYHGTSIDNWEPLRNPLTESINNLGFGTYLTRDKAYAKGAANRIYDNTLDSNLDVGTPSVHVVQATEDLRLINADSKIREASVRDYLKAILPGDIDLGNTLNAKKPTSVRDIYNKLINASVENDVMNTEKARFILDAFDEYLGKHGYDGVIDKTNNFIKVANAEKTKGLLNEVVPFNPLDKHELGDAVLAKYKTEQAGMLGNALDFSRTIDNKFELLKQANAVLDDQIKKAFDVRVATTELVNVADDVFYGNNAAKDLRSSIINDVEYMDDLRNVGAKVSDDLCDY